MKRFLSLMLSLVMCMSLATQAFALENAGQSDVFFQSDVAAPDVFNVIVPAEIPIYMSSDGSVQVAQTLAIENKSNKAVEVQKIQVNGNDEWSIRDFSEDLISEPANTHDLALSFRGDATDGAGRIAVTDGNWAVQSGKQLPILTQAKLPLQTYAGRSRIATVIWTIDWADQGTPVIPDEPSEPVVVTVLPGDHGVAELSTLYPDSDSGKIDEYPSVKASTGYDFSHFVNASDMTLVDTSTVYTEDTSIRPMFNLKSGWTCVPVEPVPGVTLVPDKNPEILIDPDGTVQVIPDVIPDDDDVTGGFVDGDGNPVGLGTTININININITININKNGDDDDNKPSYPITVSVLPGEGGNADSNTVKTDDNGKIPGFPGVTPDEGYIFDKWVDQDGNSVDSDTVMRPGDSIKPTFKPDPDYKPGPSYPITVPVQDGENGRSDVPSVDTDENGKISRFPSVTPDEGYIPDGWVDQDGNPVDSDTVFEPGDEIKPVFKPDPDYKPGPDYPITIPVRDGENGRADVDAIDTDENGKISKFPNVTPDEGYIFDKWVDQDGNPVDPDKTFVPGDEIQPVFKRDPNWNPVVLTVIPGEHGAAGVDSIKTKPDGKVPGFPDVTPEQGYGLDHWETESGTPVDENTVFTAPDTIKPVCVKKPLQIPVLPGDGGRANVVSVTTDANWQIPVYPGTTADDGYVFVEYVDKNGNPVDENTVFNPGDSIKPVFVPSAFKDSMRIEVFAGEHGTAGVYYVAANVSNRISVMPSVEADPDYAFDRWVDNKGNVADTSTVFESAVLSTSEDGSYAIYVDHNGAIISPFGTTVVLENNRLTVYRDGEPVVINVNGVDYTVGASIDKGAFMDFYGYADGKVIPVYMTRGCGFTTEAAESTDGCVITNAFSRPTIRAEYVSTRAAVVTVLPGANGIIVGNVTEVELTSEGKIPVYPDVVANDGYLFDRWIDSEGNPVDTDTIFSDGDTIQPVFIEQPIYDFIITKSNRTEVGYTGSVNEVLNIPAEFVGSDGNRYRPVAIEYKAFFGCNELKTVTMPDSILSIGEDAFGNCTKLEFITLSNNITVIEKYVFNGCTSLPSIDIPNGVTSINDFAFMTCSSLASVNLPNSLTYIGKDSFANSGLSSVTIPNSVTAMGTYAFASCPNLRTAALSRNCSVIPQCCFFRSGLTSIDISYAATIEQAAFQYCESLESVYFGGKVRTIGDVSFLGCSKLREITLCWGVNTIGREAFSSTGLSTVYVPSSVKTVGNRAFDGVPNVYYN